MIEAFLYDPNSRELALKPQAELHLGLAPEERDAVRDWLYDNKVVSRRLKKQWAAYIWKAPGDLVSRYAIGDVVRTRKLHDFFMRWLRNERVMDAYARERKLLPILLRMDREGVRVDADRLAANIEGWERSLQTTKIWVRKRLKSRTLNPDSSEQLADALENRGLVAPDDFQKTATGQRSVSVKSLTEVLKDEELLAVLDYRGKLAFNLKNNAKSWLSMSQAEGRIYTSWNQVKSADSGRFVGARTGRIQTRPNFQNVGKKPVYVVYSKSAKTKILRQDDEAKVVLLPKELQGRTAGIPWMREYIIADKDELLLDRDYSQQEPRILAHFMEGEVLDLYNEQPYIDFHSMATEMLNNAIGSHHSRGMVKAILLAIIYARGVRALAEQLGISYEDALDLRKQIKKLFPGINTLENVLRRRAMLGQPMRTWGGRIYYCEEPGYSKKFRREMTFEYKMINTLIQGSAGDCTKEAMIRYDEVKKHGRLRLQVHDELLASCSKRAAKSEMKLLRSAMDSVEFDVPMKSEGDWGPTWGSLTPFDKRGKEVWRDVA
jgi:DNA polymerase-1